MVSWARLIAPPSLITVVPLERPNPVGTFCKPIENKVPANGSAYMMLNLSAPQSCPYRSHPRPSQSAAQRPRGLACTPNYCPVLLNYSRVVPERYYRIDYSLHASGDSIVPQSNVQRQPWEDSPVILYITGILRIGKLPFNSPRL